MGEVALVGKLYVFRTPKAQFRARLAQFTEHEISNMTVRDFEALAFDAVHAAGGAGLFDTWEQKLLDHLPRPCGGGRPERLKLGRLVNDCRLCIR